MSGPDDVCRDPMCPRLRTLAGGQPHAAHDVAGEAYAALAHNGAASVHQAMQDAPHDGKPYRQARAAIAAVAPTLWDQRDRAVAHARKLVALWDSGDITGHDMCTQEALEEMSAAFVGLRALLAEVDTP